MFICPILCFSFSFFFNDTAPTEIYTLSLHDALPICDRLVAVRVELAHDLRADEAGAADDDDLHGETLPVVWLHLVDRKSTRLNSSHSQISYAVFCLKKKKKKKKTLNN